MINNIKIYKKPKFKNNYITTVCIGKNYINSWTKFILPNWLIYCKKHDLGLIMIDQPIEKNEKFLKKPHWNKLLIGSHLVKNKIAVNNICFLDNDILINHYLAPNIFKNYNNKKISVVSQVKNLPFNLLHVNKVISFNRNKYYSKKYPLDSSIFMKTKDIFKFHKFKKSFDDYFCSGFFIFNVKNHSNFLSKIFYKYNKDFLTITGGGEEPVLNFEFQNHKVINWIDYRYQAIWLYEMANKYSFLYKKINKIDNDVISCVLESLLSNYFLHFAGSWHESNMWQTKKINKLFNSFDYKKFNKYYSKKPQGIPKGKITLKNS